MFNLNKCHFETIHKPKVSSQIFSEGIVLVLQCMQSPYLYYLSLKEQVTMPWYAHQFEGNETLLMLPFYIEVNLELYNQYYWIMNSI